MLVETGDAEGSSAQIIYRNGSIVDAQSLEALCDKVCPLALPQPWFAISTSVARMGDTRQWTAGGLAPAAACQSGGCAAEQLHDIHAHRPHQPAWEARRGVNGWCATHRLPPPTQ